MRTPKELIEIYWDRIYNNMEVELIREVCANPILRHDPDYVTPLNHEEQIARVLRSAPMKAIFTHKVLHADDQFVTSVWNMQSHDGRDIKLCGIEVFRAENGRFTDCWNSTYMKGFWDEGALFDPSGLTAPELVANPIQITGEWLERAFAAGGAVKVQRIATAPHVSLIGHGTTSTTVRIRVSYNAGFLTTPRTVVCKIGRRPKGLNSVSAFERERLAYELFGPAPSFRVPKIYFGASDETGLCNLLLEDVATRPGDQIAGCSIDEAAAVVRELACFHRSYLDQPQVAALPWLNQSKELVPAFHQGIATLHEWLGPRLSPDELVTLNTFALQVEQWVALDAPRRTLIHGDPRVDNVLFEGTGSETRACLIDWQNLSSGDPLYDVAYFLSGSISPVDRRSCERDLLGEYVRLMAEVDKDFTFELAEQSYRRNIVAGLWLTVIAAAFVEQSTHNGKLIETLLHRNIEAVLDWDALVSWAAMTQKHDAKQDKET